MSADQSKLEGPIPATGLGAPTVELTAIYTLRLSVEEAQVLVGRAWTHEYEDDDGWERDLEEAVARMLPALPHQGESPIVEWA